MALGLLTSWHLIYIEELQVLVDDFVNLDCVELTFPIKQSAKTPDNKRTDLRGFCIEGRENKVTYLMTFLTLVVPDT